MALILRAAGGRHFSIPDRSAHLFGHARRYPLSRAPPGSYPSKATREGKSACEVHAYHRADAVEQAAKLAEVSAIEEVYPYRFIREMQRP
jgi:hypothetical protein